VTAIKARNENLDIAWLRDTEARSRGIAAAIIRDLEPLKEIETPADELEQDDGEKAAETRTGAYIPRILAERMFD
jgi:type I restriction enzyme M protein